MGTNNQYLALFVSIAWKDTEPNRLMGTFWAVLQKTVIKQKALVRRKTIDARYCIALCTSGDI